MTPPGDHDRPEPPSGAGLEAAGSAVLAAHAALYAAVEGGDLEAMAALWADAVDGAEPVCVHPGWTAIRGRPAILRSWAAMMVAADYIQFVLTDVHLAVAGDTAVVTCTENMMVAAEDRSLSTFESGRAVATNVLHRSPAGWQFWVHHASPLVTDVGGMTAPGAEA